jgi:hypothetical protein
LLVAGQLNALARHHKGHVVEVARVVNAMSEEQRRSLGIVDHDPDQTYHRVDRLFNKLCDALDAGHALDGVHLDAKWLANRLATAAVPAEFRTSSSVAVDGTDVETWGALHGDAVTVDLDGEATETQLIDDGTVPKAKKPARRAQVLGVGPDGRKQYTVDRDARAGHRSATNSRPAGPYVGYELHLGVQARDVRWTNSVDRTVLSDEVPGVVTCFSLVPAGTHRGRAIVDDLINAKAAGEPIDDVVWDPGYSLCKPDGVHDKLARAWIHQTFQLVTHQRGSCPFSGEPSSLMASSSRAPCPVSFVTCRHRLEWPAKRRSRPTRPGSTCGRAGAWPVTPPPTATAPLAGAARSAPASCALASSPAP